MSIPLYPIVTYPAAILAQPAAPVTAFGRPLERIIKRMVPTMRRADGIGLATNQVGLPHSLAVIEYLPRRDRRRRMTDALPLQTLVNPRILELGAEQDERSEGCLSCPGIELMIRRPTRIVVEFQTPDGKLTTQSVTGFPARIYQHEIDHLQGTLILDRAQGQRALVEAYRSKPSEFVKQIREDRV